MSLLTLGSANPKVLRLSHPSATPDLDAGQHKFQRRGIMEMNALGTLGCVGERWEGQGGPQEPGEHLAQDGDATSQRHTIQRVRAGLHWWHLRGQEWLQQRCRLGPAACSG